MRGEGWEEGTHQMGNELRIVSKLHSRGNGNLKINDARKRRKGKGRAQVGKGESGAGKRIAESHPDGLRTSRLPPGLAIVTG